MKSKKSNQFIFQKENYKIMLIGFAFITVGFILMSGGGSNNPDIFNPDMFSFRRIRLSPTLIIIGFIVEIYAILRQPKNKN